MESRNNSFGFLRLVFATAIIYSHSFILGGYGVVEPISQFLKIQGGVPSLAVIGFFVISGYLVSKSLDHCRNIFEYGWHRFLRIFPGFWMCLIVTAFVFAPFVFLIERHTLAGFSLFGTDGAVPYITTNFFILMHRYSISGLLQNVPYKGVFNGSLWTLFLELKAYVFLGILSVIGQAKNKYVLITIFFCLWSIVLFNIPVDDSPNKWLRLVIDKQFLFYATYFFAGAIIYVQRNVIPMKKSWFVAGVVLAFISAGWGYLHLLLPILAPYMIIYLAFNLPLFNNSRMGDYSYGLYIYAFPVQQTLALLGFNKSGLVYFMMAFVITWIIAKASWKWVEEPSLKLKAYRFWR